MKQLGGIIAFLSFAFANYGQNTIQTVVSSSSVDAFERFNFEIIVNSGECEINRPDFGDLDIVGGPSQSQYNSTQIINGVRSQTVEYRWTYQLRAKKEGNYTIPPVMMSCGEETYSSDPITISVGKGNGNTAEDRDYFMRLTSNKSSVFAGEPFVVTLKYYAKARPESFQALDLGDAAGVYRQDLQPDRKSFQTNMETINGMRYYTIELREELCFAQRSGKVTFEPYYAALIFQRDFFNRFQKETYSNTLTIDVKEIPGEASDFNGLVGDFSVKGEMSQTHVKMGDAIDIKITVEGKGNLQDLGDIKLDFPTEFDTFDPEIEDQTSVSSAGFSGKIEYNFVVIPKHYGNYTIPGYAFSYFDLDARKMKHVSTEDFVIKVDKREVDVVGPEIPTEETDIHYIEEQSGAFFEQDDFIFGSWTYYSLLVSPLCASLLFVFFRRKKENISEDELHKMQQKKAVKNAQIGLKAVQQQLDQGANKEALKGLQTVLNQFFMLKFKVGLSDLSQRGIDARLAENNVDETLRTEFNRIWNAIEMGQYAPIPHENLLKTVRDTEQLIIDLDKYL